MAKIISVANQKGGVGKTTTTINLGISLAKEGKKVLLVDLDSQANLTMSLGFEPDELEKSIVDLIIATIEDKEVDKLKYILNKEGIDFIPSDIRLSGMENTLVNVMGREKVLKNTLEILASDYDYILIDCMPSLNVITLNALVASDSVLIPVQSHYLSAHGLELLIDTIKKVKKQLNPALTIEGILITMYDRRTSRKHKRKWTFPPNRNYGERRRLLLYFIWS